MQDDVVVIDTETTGLSKRDDRIVELAASLVDPRSGASRNVLHVRLNPGRPIPPRATMVHGLSDRDVAGAPPFSSIADKLLRLLRGGVVVAHNAAFDVGMIEAEFARIGVEGVFARSVVVDTLDVARTLLPECGRYRLEDVCAHLGVDVSARTRHGALVDVELLGAALPGLAAAYDRRPSRTDLGSPADAATFDEAGERIARLAASAETASVEALEPLCARLAAVSKRVEASRSLARDAVAARLDAGRWEHPDIVVRETTRRSVDWAGVWRRHRPEADASAFSRASVVSTVRVRRFGAELDAMLDLPWLVDGTAEMIRAATAAIRLDALAASADAAKRLARERLLTAYDHGYRPVAISISRVERSSVSYKRAVQETLASLDVSAFVSERRVLAISPRDLASCDALFASEPD